MASAYCHLQLADRKGSWSQVQEMVTPNLSLWKEYICTVCVSDIYTDSSVSPRGVKFILLIQFYVGTLGWRLVWQMMLWGRAGQRWPDQARPTQSTRLALYYWLIRWTGNCRWTCATERKPWVGYTKESLGNRRKFIKTIRSDSLGFILCKRVTVILWETCSYYCSFRNFGILEVLPLLLQRRGRRAMGGRRESAPWVWPVEGTMEVTSGSVGTVATYGVFTPEQDNDKTTTRQKLNLCIPMMPFTPGPTWLVWKAS